MHRRHTRLAALAASAAVALGTSALTGTATGAAAAAPGSPLTLYAPEKVIAYGYEGQVYTDLGLRLVAPVEAFEVWSSRATYDDPIVSEWRPATGPAVPLPEGSMEDFNGLEDFMTIEVHKASDGTLVNTWQQDACLNGDSQRVSPDAPPRSPYPWGCPWNPYTVGSVMGIEGGHASTIMQAFQEPLSLKRGKYDVVATINDTFTSLFGIAAEDATGTTRLIVKNENYEGQPKPSSGPASRTPKPAAYPPTGPGAAPDGPAPDLRSLPAWGIQLNRKGTTLRFAATVWNAGDSPLVVDGFRAPGEDHMDAYQYFFDTDGNQTGYQQVGQMHWHAENHQHWHFEDFAQYRLYNEDMSESVLSTKQSFCLANTDAVDYTVPGADWHPENTDLSTACGGPDAISVRQVLSAGSGDTYVQYRYGQAFPIKDLPNGTYFVAVEANPLFDGERNLVESDTTNNDSFREITLKGKPDNRRVVVAPVGVIDESMPGWMRRRY